MLAAKRRPAWVLRDSMSAKLSQGLRGDSVASNMDGHGFCCFKLICFSIFALVKLAWPDFRQAHAADKSRGRVASKRIHAATAALLAPCWSYMPSVCMLMLL